MCTGRGGTFQEALLLAGVWLQGRRDTLLVSKSLQSVSKTTARQTLSRVRPGWQELKAEGMGQGGRGLEEH